MIFSNILLTYLVGTLITRSTCTKSDIMKPDEIETDILSTHYPVATAADLAFYDQSSTGEINCYRKLQRWPCVRPAAGDVINATRIHFRAYFNP